MVKEFDEKTAKAWVQWHADAPARAARDAELERLYAEERERQDREVEARVVEGVRAQDAAMSGPGTE